MYKNEDILSHWSDLILSESAEFISFQGTFESSDNIEMQLKADKFNKYIFTAIKMNSSDEWIIGI